MSADSKLMSAKLKVRRGRRGAVDSDRGIRLGHGRKQSIQGPDCFRLEQNIAANRANLRGHMVDHHHAALVTHGLDDGALLVVTRASLDAACKGRLAAHQTTSTPAVLWIILQDPARSHQF